MILKILGVIILFLMLIFLRYFIIGYYRQCNAPDAKIRIGFKDFLTYFKIDEENFYWDYNIYLSVYYLHFWKDRNRQCFKMKSFLDYLKLYFFLKKRDKQKEKLNNMKEQLEFTKEMQRIASKKVQTQEEENLRQINEILKITERRNVKDEVVSSWGLPWKF